jgi:hypothetical protein
MSLGVTPAPSGGPIDAGQPHVFPYHPDGLISRHREEYHQFGAPGSLVGWASAHHSFRTRP